MCTTITMFKNSLTMFKNLLKYMLFMYLVLPIGAACLHVFGWRETWQWCADLSDGVVCFTACCNACVCVLIFLVAKCGSAFVEMAAGDPFPLPPLPPLSQNMGLSPAEAATWKALTWKALFGRNYEWQ